MCDDHALTLGMLVAECRVSHICQFDVGFGAGIHELVALCGMELCGGDNFRQFLHIDRLDVDDI